MSSLISSPWFPQSGILYIIFCIIFVCEPRDLQGLGLTVEGLFSSWLGSRSTSFLQYQIRRFYVTVAFHSCLPIFYGFYLSEPYAQLYISIATVPMVMVVSVLALYHYEVLVNPIERQLIRMKMISETFEELIASVNHEFRLPTKFQNGNNTVYVTDTFIIKVSTYRTFICRQTEAQCQTVKVNDITVAGSEVPDQNLTIDIVAGETKFQIYIKGSELEDFESQLRAPLKNLDTFEVKDLWSKFIDESLGVVSKNDRAIRRETDIIDDDCFGCTMKKCEVRLTSCECRAMWCFSCLIRCFAAHQDHQRLATNQWLSGKCGCPNCRTEFNLLDIALFSDLENS